MFLAWFFRLPESLLVSRVSEDVHDEHMKDGTVLVIKYHPVLSSYGRIAAPNESPRTE